MDALPALAIDSLPTGLARSCDELNAHKGDGSVKKSRLLLLALGVVVLAMMSGCSTLSVKIPDGMYVSMGDYNDGVRTDGIIQVQTTAWTPLFVLYDISKVRQDLYKALLDKAGSLHGITGITNVTFYSKPSILSVLAPVTLGIGIWIDYYAEGVVITRKP
jgi:hypothetical protein